MYSFLTRSRFPAAALALLGLGPTSWASGALHYLLGYCSLVHAVITTLVIADTSPWVIGKDARTGQVPWWSWLVRSPCLSQP
jgi:hypothetical protein